MLDVADRGYKMTRQPGAAFNEIRLSRSSTATTAYADYKYLMFEKKQSLPEQDCCMMN